MPEKSRQAKMLGKDPLVQLLARTFGENVRVLRESEHLTKKELADMVGSSRSHITDIEDGLIDADFSKVVKFARAFERPLDALLTPGGALHSLGENERG